MKTGNTVIVDGNLFATVWPQWSPVMKTGNTHVQASYHFSDRGASMEPGHEDREYVPGSICVQDAFQASMEPGHEDREYFRRRLHLIPHRHASMEPGHEDREYGAAGAFPGGG